MRGSPPIPPRRTSPAAGTCLAGDGRARSGKRSWSTRRVPRGTASGGRSPPPFATGRSRTCARPVAGRATTRSGPATYTRTRMRSARRRPCAPPARGRSAWIREHTPSASARDLNEAPRPAMSNARRSAPLHDGWGGIRTREGCDTPHAFQACALNHSATHPEGRRNARSDAACLNHLDTCHLATCPLHAPPT